MEETGKKPINGLQDAHFKGAAHEHLAAYWYMSHGHQVYWPAVQQGGVDFVVDKGGSLFKVQVKTGSWSRQPGGYSYLQARTRSTNKTIELNPCDCYDILVVIHNGSLWEIPSEVIDTTNLCLASTEETYRGSRWQMYKRELFSD